MNGKQDRRPARRALLRGGLLFVAATPPAGGLWALLAPRAFYEDFLLPGREWVSTLGPYNEHLIRDYGALNLALAVMLVAAAVYLEWRLARVALVAWPSSRPRTSSSTSGRPTTSLPAPTWSNWAVWGSSSCCRYCCFSSPRPTA